MLSKFLTSTAQPKVETKVDTELSDSAYTAQQ